MEIQHKYSPWYDPNVTEKITGKLHRWIPFEGKYYGPAFFCAACYKKNKGWNLWKEDFLETCPGDRDIVVGSEDEGDRGGS